MCTQNLPMEQTNFAGYEEYENGNMRDTNAIFVLTQIK